ncbi:MAG: hypothetical protein AB7U82_15370 [Blastocatellales bacterium]
MAKFKGIPKHLVFAIISLLLPVVTSALVWIEISLRKESWKNSVANATNDFGLAGWSLGIELFLRFTIEFAVGGFIGLFLAILSKSDLGKIGLMVNVLFILSSPIFAHAFLVTMRTP